jgi:dTDP-4-amino-4,6-dideoxygalactose transaminase
VEQEVLNVLRSGQLAQGPKVAELEAIVAGLSGCSHAVAVTSGTVALEMALTLAGLGPGDEVITSPLTFAATLNAIIHSGCTATFVDVDDDGLMDVASIPACRTPRTRALMPVHLYGLPVDLTNLTGAEELTIVEDAAQAIGARVGDRLVGSFGLGCFSLYATKNVTTGEGGVLTTKDTDIATRARILRNQGMRGRYDYVFPGRNHRMTDLQAAVGVPQLLKLTEINNIRAANARQLIKGLADLEGLILPRFPSTRTHVWHQFTVRITDEAPVTRDRLAEHLKSRGIATSVYYPRLVFDYECYRNHPLVRTSQVPRAMNFTKQVLSLPVHPGLQPADIDRIVAEVHNAFRA